MSETSGESSIQQPAKITRRGWLRGALSALGLVAAGGAVLKGAEIVGSIPNSDQKKAGELLDRKDVPKQVVEVMNDPEVVQEGGLAVRNEPRIPEKGEPPGVEYRLPPRTKFEAIPWAGRSLDYPSTPSTDWAAFRDERGIVHFVSTRFLENITIQSKKP